jgi:hypothetical protein
VNGPRRLVDAISKLVALVAGPSAPAPVAPTEDDLASEKFFQRLNRDRAVVGAQPGQPRRATE